MIDNFVFRQYGLKKGFKVFGEKGKEAAIKEMKQLHMRNCFKPLGEKELSSQDKKNALGSLIFLKEKDSGEIKGRACADGRKQREHIEKGEAASSTVSLESIVLTSVIDTEEGRDVAVINIPNAFVQTEMDKNEKVIMKLSGELAELLVTILPKLYRKYIRIEKGKKVLYVELLKALYDTLKISFVIL